MGADSYQIERDDMVERQIVRRGIHDSAVIEALRRVPRHLFVPPSAAASAYQDRPLAIDCGQTISQPYMVALMTAKLDTRPQSRVLEVGTGSGYQTAVLAELVEEVVSIERHPQLAETARARLDALGYNNVEIIEGDGSQGHPEGAPYDGIVVTAGSPALPHSLQEQLALGGRLVCPVGPRDLQRLYVVRRTDTGFDQDEGIRCMFVPLIGAEGWGDHEG